MTLNPETVSEIDPTPIEVSSIDSDTDSDSELFDLYCPTCLLSFKDESSFQAHYKSDLHIYNSRRAVAQLKPVSIEAFENRLASKPSTV